MKQHPIEIECVSEFEGDTLQLYFTKGWHESDVFLKEFDEQVDPTFVRKGLKLEERFIKRGFARKVPFEGGYLYLKVPDDHNGRRGVFPVTEYDFETCEYEWKHAKKQT